MPYIGSSPNFGSVESQTITSANGSTAAFTLNQFVPDSDSIIVTIGNVVQEPTTAYSASGTTITFTENVPNGDTIVIRYLGRSVDVPTTYKHMDRYKFVATNNQGTFTDEDANGLTLSYSAGNIDVFMNGVRLDESDFTASNGTSVVLASNAATNDDIIIISYKTFQVANALDKSSGGTVAGNTTFSGQAYFSGGIFGDVSFDSGALKIDSGNNRVGVNTNSPADAFHAYLASGQRVARFEANDSTSAHISFKANNTSLMPTVGVKDEALYFSTGDAVERMRIDDAGKVGIGLTTPLAKLDVNGTTDAELRITRQTASVSSNYADQGSVLHLFNDINFENGYDGNSHVGQIIFSSDDNSTGQGIRAKIACTKPSYSHSENLSFYTSPANTTSGQATATSNTTAERVRIEPGGDMITSNRFLISKELNASYANADTGFGWKSGQMRDYDSFANITGMAMGISAGYDTGRLPGWGHMDNIAMTHWGAIVLVGYHGAGQGYYLVAYGYGTSPTILYSANWTGSAIGSASVSGYYLRFTKSTTGSHNVWAMVIGV